VHLRYPTRDIFQVIFEVIDTHDRLVVITSHWPSRRQGKEHSEPSRMTVAENIAFLVRDHVRCSSPEYLQRKADGDLAAVQAKFDTPVLILGDFNDEPSDASVIGHLQASSELDRVVGATNQITKFETEVATYRGDDTWLYNACWKFLAPEDLGTFFIESTAAGSTSPTATRCWTTWSPPAGCCCQEASPSTRPRWTSTGPPVSPPQPAVPAHSTRRPRRAPPTTSQSPPY